MADEALTDVDFDKFFDDLAAKENSAETVAAAPEPVTEPVVAEPVSAPEPVSVTAETPPPAETPEPVTEPDVASHSLAASEPASHEPTTREMLEAFMAQMAKAQQPAPAPQPAPQRPALYNDTELSTLGKYQKDWPEHAEAFQLMLRGALTANNQYTFDQIAQAQAQRDRFMEDMADKQQREALFKLIPDYGKVRDPAIQWARTDPSIPDPLRVAYNSVIDGGSPQDIVWLVDSYRQATGKVTQKPAAKKDTELSEAAKQAAQTLAPVVTQRTAQVPSEPVDYDGAFKRFAATEL